MIERTIYIAGPMRHIEYYNMDAFNRAADMFRKQKWNVINPVEVDKESGCDISKLPPDTDWNSFPPGFSLTNTVAACCLGVIDSDAIYMLDGWGNSKGAMAEHMLAKWLGLEIFYE